MKSWFEVLNASKDSAEIFIYDEIGLWGITADDFRREVSALEAKEITLRINSPGGSVFQGITIYNFLRSLSATIHVKIDGVAASIASVIALAGDTIEMADTAMFMIHNPMGGVFGESEEMRKMADLVDQLKEQVVAIYVARTGKTEKEISDLMDATTWMKPALAIELGFVDGTYNSVKIAACFEMEKYGFENVSQYNEIKNISKPNPKPEPKPGVKPMNLEQLKAEYPALYNQLFDMGKAAGEAVAVEVIDTARTEGATAERERIQAIEAAAVPGAEKIIAEEKFKPEATAGSVSQLILAAAREKKIELVNQVKKDSNDLDNLENQIDGSGANNSAGDEAEDKAIIDAMVEGGNE